MNKNLGNRFELRVIPQIIRSLLFRRATYIFQMGRVGSSSVYKSILGFLNEQDARSKNILFHDHGITLRDFCIPLNFSLQGYKFIVAWRARLGLPLSVICPIREPIARDVSAFFYFGGAPESPGSPPDMREIKERFLANPRNPNAKAPPNEKISNPLYTLDWFDRYFRLLTRIDVYKKPFPIDRKWQTYRRGFTRVLVYRNDLKLSEQAELISHFLGIKLGEIQNRNSVKNENYSRFCESVKLPEWYIRRTHDSRFARHFWSPAELKAVADKWRGVSGS